MSNTSGKTSSENERRVDHLINLVERETRTERHLEQNSEISNPENLKHAKEVQQGRNEEIKNLKNIIVHGEHSNNDQVKNLEKRYEYTNGYLDHNADHMDNEALKNTVEKQEHRKDQLNSMK
ncbi:hypothetical protein Ana3638_10185 [Anaerocolumna sedimenticola]|uniref:Uncharacterized protein n=2 Tax=Anaerocolumna sedimenticola TaxID=2696063 RepID=A0A6P1TVG4_9FIRM|nr:hypothetical protein Ana3638_10185 [Anaerocolumna sedimenticola]